MKFCIYFQIVCILFILPIQATSFYGFQTINFNRNSHSLQGINILKLSPIKEHYSIKNIHYLNSYKTNLVGITYGFGRKFMKNKIFNPFSEINLNINFKNKFTKIFIGPVLCFGVVVSLENNWFFKSSLVYLQSNDKELKNLIGYRLGIIKQINSRRSNINNGKIRSKKTKSLKKLHEI